MYKYIVLFMMIKALPMASRVQEAAGVLPIDKAYALSADAGTPGVVKLHWTIAPDYSLYRGQMKFKGGAGVMLGEARLPDGKKYHDEYLGDVETYHDGIDATVPYTLAPGVQRIRLSVRYQGCREVNPKICYPPHTEELDLALPSSAGTSNAETDPMGGAGSTASAPAGPLDDANTSSRSRTAAATTTCKNERHDFQKKRNCNYEFVGRMPPPGIWQARGYGSIFRIEPGNITLYETLGSQCLLQSRMTPNRFSGTYGDWTPDGARSDTAWHLVVSGMTVDRLDRLPAACAQAAGVPDSNPLRNFDFLWSTFDVHYAFFAAHGVDWHEVHDIYRARVAALPGDGDPFPIFADMLALLKDTHVRLSDGKRVARVKKFPVATQAGPNGPMPLDDHYLQKQLVAYLQGNSTPLTAAAVEAGNREIYYGKLRPRADATARRSYGYVAIFSMDRFGKGDDDDVPLDARVRTVDAAMNEVVAGLRDVDGVVLDLRYNGGGEEAVALAIAGHFASAPRPVWTKRVYENGKTHPPYAMQVNPSAGNRLPVPLAVLTSDFTVSAAETATLALRALPATVQIGQPTRGVLSDRLEKVLPNGWSFSLSNEIYMDPHGNVFEVNGVPPDLPTPAPPPTSPDALRFGRDIDSGVAALDRLLRDGKVAADNRGGSP